MRKIKVIFDFIRFPIPEKIGFCRNVVSKMTGNTSFPNPDVNLVTANTQVDELQTYFLSSSDGSRTQKSIMHSKELQVIDTFRRLASYVDRIADGDETMILSSGFNLSKKAASYSKAELSIKNGEISGSVKLVARAIDGAKSYVWQYVKDTLPVNGEGWSIAGFSTKANILINNLDIASKYWFRMAAVTPNGTTGYTNAIMKVVE